MDRLSLLVKAKETAEYFTDKKFKYSQGVANSWAGAKKKKVSNCASYVCYCLQQLGILKPGQLFYCNRNGTVIYKGAGTKTAISKRYRLIKVNKLPRDYKNKLKPGDICFYRLHTNIFAGVTINGFNIKPNILAGADILFFRDDIRLILLHCINAYIK